MSFSFSFGENINNNPLNISSTLFSKNIPQNQTSLFNIQENKQSNNGQSFQISSSLFKKNNQSPLFSEQSTQNNPTKNLFGNYNQEDDDNKKSENNSNLFSLGTKTKKKDNNNVLFGKQESQDDIKLNLFADKSNQKINNNALFKNEKNKKENNSGLFGQSLFGVKTSNSKDILSGNFPKDNNNNKESEDSNSNTKSLSLLFGNKNQEKENNNIENKDKDEIKQDKGGLFSGILGQKNEGKSLFLFSQPSSNEEKPIFGINKNLFPNNEEKKEEKEEEDKKENITDNINKEKININNIFGTPKKEVKKEIEIITNSNQVQINKNEIRENSNLNSINNLQNLSSNNRLDDNEQVQNALQNLFNYNILSNSKSSKQSSLDNSKYSNNKLKRNKPINFKLVIEIEGISNINSQEINMTSLSNENMDNLMNQVKIILKKKFKMNKEQSDFDIYLIKNGKKLPINDRELIGDYIKNQDKIIISLIHHSLEINERKEEDEDNDEEEIENTKKNEKKVLCPQEKLPILKRQGYYMYPNEYDIARMSIDEIKNIKNFAIYNENGKIEFNGNVSLYGVNFDKLFNIEHDLIEYEKGQWYHSPRGKNFNIPATITLYNINPNINLSNEKIKKQYIEFLKTKCQKYFNGIFLSYNFETFELKYKIPYFY